MAGFVFPIVDLVPWYAERDRRAVALRVRDACETIGFFAVRGHRVPAVTIEGMRSTSRAFFDLPLSRKPSVTVAGYRNERFARKAAGGPLAA